ncbi:DedA family protein [Asanoa sp. NPDC050611]|uniref:DedA family protein n=1 Tax=Asanoa sp. NPDC050611 TaxID=3157098 RepID=UPI0033FE251D
MALAAQGDPSDLGGLTGWVAGVIDSLGTVGVGLLVALENLVPPIPSEIVLTLGGFLANQGRMSLPLVILSATVGSVVGAVILYWLGRGLGEDRLKRWLDKIPLVDTDDLEKADRWFERHENAAVLFGRCVPVVRSLVSIPAGANEMPMIRFVAFTTLGSAVWNSLFVGAGFALGSNWQRVEQYAQWFDYAIYALVAVGAVLWIRKKIRKRNRAKELASRS